MISCMLSRSDTQLKQMHAHYACDQFALYPDYMHCNAQISKKD